MDTFECIKTRRATRKYLDVPVAWDLVSNILEAGRYAPSAGNLQNWKFIVILEKPKREAIAEACLKQMWMAEAPVIIVICAEPKKAERYYGIRGERLYTIQNCAAVAANMLLEAHNQGLGGCWVGAFDEEMVKRALAMPEEARPQIILTFGYPDEKVPVPTRFPLEPMTYFERWRGRIQDVPTYFGYFGPKIQKFIKSGEAFARKHGKKVAEKTKEVAKKVKKKIQEKKKKS
ncbi:nitroreductase family protein [Candidatus Woesearchaeota archaeon]|nr:nitroreductase family protein [Candidatus Woesearchaeota archaeon]